LRLCSDENLVFKPLLSSIRQKIVPLLRVPGGAELPGAKNLRQREEAVGARDNVHGAHVPVLEVRGYSADYIQLTTFNCFEAPPGYKPSIYKVAKKLLGFFSNFVFFDWVQFVCRYVTVFVNARAAEPPQELQGRGLRRWGSAG
jgi:hypothetical protein